MSAVVANAAGRVEASAIVALLSEAGIDAVAVPAAGGVGGSDAPSTSPVPVRVSVLDVERARAALAETAAVDWDDVDVGARVDNVPLTRPGRPPIAARIAQAVAIAIALIAVIAGVIALVV